MTFTRPVTDVIRQRSSWRAYEARPLGADVRQRLETVLADTEHGPLGGQVRIVLADVEPPNFLQLRQHGTYGMIKGARTYLIGAVRRSDHAMEDYGFAFERALLHATDLGLGTCWLGGTLDRSSFGRRIGVHADEVVPAVSPVGYATTRRALRDVVVRLGAGSHKRVGRERLFFGARFDAPLAPADAGAYWEPLEMVRLAPSASNRQPWRILHPPGEDVFHLYLQRSRFYDNKLFRMPLVDLQRIDMGIAMCHFQLSAGEAGLTGAWEQREPRGIALPPRTEYVVSWTGA